MNKGVFLALCVVAFLVASCGAVTPIPPTLSVTLTATPTRTPTPTIIPSLSKKASPTGSSFSTHPVQPTLDAYHTAVADVCPTTIPGSDNHGRIGVLSDSQILREFAGRYGMSSGFQALSLVINCDGTFVGSSFDDVGGGAFHSGNVKVKNGKMYLNLNPTSEDTWFFPNILIPVRWSQRKYLIEDFMTDYFCETITPAGGALEPRSDSGIGYFLLRDGDEKLEAAGFPIYPSGEKICP